MFFGMCDIGGCVIVGMCVIVDMCDDVGLSAV